MAGGVVETQMKTRHHCKLGREGKKKTNQKNKGFLVDVLYVAALLSSQFNKIISLIIVLDKVFVNVTIIFFNVNIGFIYFRPLCVGPFTCPTWYECSSFSIKDRTGGIAAS